MRTSTLLISVELHPSVSYMSQAFEFGSINVTTRKHTVASGSLVVDLSILNRRRKQILRFFDTLLDIGVGRLKKERNIVEKNHLIFISSWPIAYCLIHLLKAV